MTARIVDGIEWFGERGECARCGSSVRSTGGTYHCVSSPEYCESHPLPGREWVGSTALSPNEWVDR